MKTLGKGRNPGVRNLACRGESEWVLFGVHGRRSPATRRRSFSIRAYLGCICLDILGIWIGRPSPE